MFLCLDEIPPDIEHLPERVFRDLQSLSTWLQNCGSPSDFVTVYSTMRSHTLLKTLQR